jgi:hypothetical protein
MQSDPRGVIRSFVRSRAKMALEKLISSQTKQAKIFLFGQKPKNTPDYTIQSIDLIEINLTNGRGATSRVY